MLCIRLSGPRGTSLYLKRSDGRISGSRSLDPEASDVVEAVFSMQWHVKGIALLSVGERSVAGVSDPVIGTIPYPTNSSNTEHAILR